MKHCYNDDEIDSMALSGAVARDAERYDVENSDSIEKRRSVYSFPNKCIISMVSFRNLNANDAAFRRLLKIVRFARYTDSVFYRILNLGVHVNRVSGGVGGQHLIDYFY